MRSSLLKAGLVVLATGALLAAPLSAASAQSAADLDVIGLLDGNRLVQFQTDDTRTSVSSAITGLTGDVSLVGIDYRVQNGLLYGVGNAGGLYTLVPTGAATKVGQLSVALSGANFGVDFNPAANALRVISDTGQNLRQPFAGALTGTTVTDTPLTNPAVPPATAAAGVGVTGAAYTNNDLDVATATTLFDIDTASDRVSIQSPANAGTLAPTGNLGVDAGPNAGFDIYSTLRGGRTVDVAAYATLQVGNRYALYSIDLLNGEAVRVGALRGNVTDIAIPIKQ